jgi:hypothetical protein
MVVLSQMGRFGGPILAGVSPGAVRTTARADARDDEAFQKWDKGGIVEIIIP